jgi:hypothetical protein
MAETLWGPRLRASTVMHAKQHAEAITMDWDGVISYPITNITKKKNKLTAENATGRIQKKFLVSNAPWIGAEPRHPKLPSARAIPVRALTEEFQ